ncbi:MAG: hypothetical protein ACK57P_12495, partial [Planctomycetota bacterium]
GERARENPVAALGQLPPDVADAVAQLHLAIRRHRSASWIDLSPSKRLNVIDALRTFAQSPS